MIVYIGNMMPAKGGSLSVIDTLSEALSRHHPVAAYSPAANQVIRLFEMLKGVWINRKKASLVLIDAYSSKAFWYTAAVTLLCRLLGLRYVPIIHGGDFPARLRKSRFWCRQVFCHSEQNISPSLYLLHHFRLAGFNVRYIPNSVEVGDFPFRHRTAIGPRLLWVRAFHETYNPSLAVETLATLLPDYPGMELCMIGSEKDGSLAKTKRRAEELGVSDRVSFPGSMTRKEWVSRSDKYGIFLNTTNFDNMPLSIIEAMALGLIIVSTNVGGLPYLLSDGEDALLVPPADKAEMCSAVRRILEDPHLQSKLSAAARKKAEGFSWNLIEKQWLALINEIQNADRR